MDKETPRIFIRPDAGHEEAVRTIGRSLGMNHAHPESNLSAECLRDAETSGMPGEVTEEDVRRYRKMFGGS